MAKNLHISAMSFAIGSDDLVKDEAHLLPAGDFAPTDGRVLPVASFKLDETIAHGVIAKMAARKNDTLIDYEHQSLYASDNGQPVIAAGWFHEMDFRADGLWAINVRWTETAKRRIAEKEYRYVSAVFAYDEKTGAVADVISIALTNTPALDGLQSLAALSKFQDLPQDLNTGDLPMPEKDVAALTTERDTLKTNVASLTAENGTLKTDIVALSVERDALKAKVEAVETAQAATALATEKTKHGELITAALTDGRIAPAQKAWAEKQSLAVLTEYLDASKPILPAGRQHVEGDEGEPGLTNVELAMCNRMHITPEAFAKSKAQIATERNQAHA